MPRRTSTPDHCWEVYKALAHFARFFNQALQRLDEEEVKDVWTCGHESLVANDLLSTGTWQVIASWLWKRPAHINILESCAFVTLLKHLATRGGGVRFSALLDSRVAKGSISKGRSSAYALSPALRRAAAIQVAFGLYPSLGFAPTRLNVADDPTRDQRLREPAAHSILPFLSPHAVRETTCSWFLTHLRKLAATCHPPDAPGGQRGLQLCFSGISSGASVDFWTSWTSMDFWTSVGLSCLLPGGLDLHGLTPLSLSHRSVVLDLALPLLAVLSFLLLWT